MFGWNVRPIGMSELVLLDKVVISVIFWKMTSAKVHNKQRVEGQMVITIIIVLI